MRCVSGERRHLVCPLPHPDTNGAPAPALRPAIPGQPEIRGARVYRPSQTPHLPLSPERVAPGVSRALDARSESPLGARLPASPVLSQLLGAGRGDAPGAARTAPARAAAGVIREKGPARVQSRRRHRRPPRPGPPWPETTRAAGAQNPAPSPRGGGGSGAHPAVAETASGGGGREIRGGASPSRGSRPAPLRTPARPTQPLEPILIPKLRI
ncbi:hypothetical protein AAFF_G00420290 [Aldrovandia affinis]|uniref:Uncharacterized protein n=1 Tax=Aldrovandia affinis TaxID=143900 RepID=A0AAD7VYI6_9TELE|nr:hypothetical protein AAFF_G00420290 [Aldrovandia affinis]